MPPEMLIGHTRSRRRAIFPVQIVKDRRVNPIDNLSINRLSNWKRGIKQKIVECVIGVSVEFVGNGSFSNNRVRYEPFTEL
jgi:hypothetical protein